MVAQVVSVGLWEKYRVSASQLSEISAICAKPTSSAQHDVKDGAAGKIDVQTPWRTQFGTPENAGLQRNGAEDVGYEVAIRKVCE
jgi:hypothetical protein